MKIEKTIEIEDLVKYYPQSVAFLSEKGIRCLRCGEPIWGTFEEAAKEKGFDDKKIDVTISELQDFLDQKT